MFFIELIICFIATVGFGVIFSVPKRALLLGGGIGVIAYSILNAGLYFDASPVFSTAAASLTAALISHMLARFVRIPVTTLAIPGILPLVPGSRAYFTMLSFVDGEYLTGLEYGVETMLRAGAIAAGLVFALAVFSFGKGVGHRYETNR
ncbi:threonine/serine exporter family protein [Alteribacter natronophilus]|uniref:threonine/serine exporter family protein n=1 Tax=Alteribacter natronophilus TaxID=2583810 RepID=UPI00110F664E|nr:threonine/serine exporter family protein [Alteribacter natronophilus]TMW69942.1 threonine/serine exporter [Alteribacter natronophilus]